MQYKFFIIYDNRVACIAAALVSDDYIERFREYVNDLALALVTPLQTDEAGVQTPVQIFHKNLAKPSEFIEK